MIRRSTQIGLITLVLATSVLLSGCQSFQNWTLRMRHHDQLRRADNAFMDQDYLYAATLYESISDRYPSDEPRRAAFLRDQGIALYQENAYHDARRVFLQLIHEFPDTGEAADARANISKIDFLMSPQAERRVEALDAAQRDLDRLGRLRQEYPYDQRIHRTIGDIYWDMGDYDRAVSSYARAMELDAATSETLLNGERMRVVDEDGTLAPILPEEAHELDREENPLRVFNLHEYYQRGRGIHQAFLQKYTLTGMVRNQSRRIIRNVRIHVTFYNVTYDVLGSERQMIGTLGPGEVRSFVITTDTADNLYNIAHYDYEVIGEER